MEKTPFIIQHLAIQRMPGFRNGIKPFENLANHINIITGPNASGKSSTARAMQQIIWQNDKNQDLSAESSVSLGEDQWRIELDVNRANVQRNGITDSINVPPYEERNRYLLSLHQLIKEEESDLAKEIARQASGGYDLEAVHNKFSYSNKAKTTNINEYRNFNDKLDKYKKAFNIQSALKKEEEELERLIKQREEAKSAESEREFYKKVIEYYKANGQLSQLEAQLKEFPTAIKDLIGNEFTTIEDNEKIIEEAKGAIRLAEYEIAGFDEQLNKLTIPEEGVSEQILEEIEERVNNLESIEREIGRTQQEIKQLKAKENAILKGIDSSLEAEDWKGIKIEDVSGLDSMFQKAQQVLGERAILNAEIDLLKRETESLSKNKEENAEKLQSGISALALWLKEPIKNGSNAKGISKNALLYIAIAGIATAVLSAFIGWWGLLGIIAVVLIYFTSLQQKEQTQDGNVLSMRESDYEKQGFPPLAHWDVENVIEKIEELLGLLKDRKQAEKQSNRLNSLKKAFDNNGERLKVLEEESKKWRTKLQVVPSFKEIENKEYATLYIFITTLKQWQDVHFEKEEKLALEESLAQKHIVEFEKINSLFSQFNFGQITDAVAGKSTLRALRNQEQTRKEKTSEKSQKEREILSKKEEINKSQERIDTIYKTLKLSESNKEEIRQLSARKEDYIKTEREHFAAEARSRENLEVLKGYSFFPKFEKIMNDLSIDQVEEKIDELGEIANELESVQEKITTIRTNIQNRKEGNELESALAEREEAIEQLEQVQEENIASAVGDLILKHLKKETEQKNQPKVFTRASEILSKVTNGRYHLLPMGGDHIGFMAKDTKYDRGQNLSELSTGTRIQLLLAVRIAYVESIETSIKLPLLVDELLANSDDERAQAIIDTLIQISQEGRQIFYFTAQTDEVRKWKEYLKDGRVDYKIIQLQTGEEVLLESNIFEANNISLSPAIASPNGMSHAEYRKEINVPTFHPNVQAINELHLWYLIENVDYLYACLRNGIDSWGQFQAFIEYDGKIEGMEKDDLEQLNQKVEILEKFTELYQQGRPKAINSIVLSQSGAVTDTFLERINDVLVDSKHNPQELLRRLRDSDTSVLRYTEAKISELENYLIEEGYIDERDVLSEEEILVRLQAGISNMNIEKGEVEKLIERVLS